MPLNGLPVRPAMRIAPTPSGYLHLGNAASFLLTHRLARALGGTLLLRIDDLDRARVRHSYVSALFEDLQRLGIDPDRGPRNEDELDAWSQHTRVHRAHALLDRLRAQGLLYACTCSRRQARPQAGGTSYAGTCRDAEFSLDTPGAAWRLRLPFPAKATFREWPLGEVTVDLSASMGDPVLRQRDGLPAYQVMSLADDVHFGTALIVRGMDLWESTACQVWIAEQLGLPGFPTLTFIHHPLLRDAKGNKLSKSSGARSFRAAGSAVELQAVEREAGWLWQQVIDRT